MAEFTRICAKSELPKPGEVREFTAKNRALCVANLGGSICVLDGSARTTGGLLVRARSIESA